MSRRTVPLRRRVSLSTGFVEIISKLHMFTLSECGFLLKLTQFLNKDTNYLMGNNGEGKLSASKIAEALDMDRNLCVDYLNRLAKQGILQVDRGGNGHSNYYIVDPGFCENAFGAPESECYRFREYRFNAERRDSIRRRDSIKPKLRFEILKRDGFRCKYCGHGEEDGVKLHVDHIVALANGGTTEPDNLVTACENCNAGKSDIPLGATTIVARELVSR